MAGNDEGTARASQRLAYIYWHAGYYNKAIPLYERTLAIVRKIAGTNTHDIAVCLNNIGLNYRALGDVEKAKQMHTEALDTLRGAGHPEPNLLADTYMAMGMLALTRYQYAEAEDWLNRAKPIVEKFQSEDMAYVRLMDTYTRLYIEMGKPREAEYTHRQIWPIMERKVAADAPERLRYLDTRANVYFGLQRYTEAAKIWTEAIAVADRLGIRKSPDMISIVSHLGELYLYMNDLENAEPYLIQSAVHRSAGSRDHHGNGAAAGRPGGNRQRGLAVGGVCTHRHRSGGAGGARGTGLMRWQLSERIRP